MSDLKAPGWGRVVAELASAAPDDRAYFERMLRVLAQVSAARVAALMLADRAGAAADGEEIEPRVASVWPAAGPAAAGLRGGRGLPGGNGNGNGSSAGAGGDGPLLENAKEMKDAARAAFSSAQPRAFALEKGTDPYYGSGPLGGAAGFVVAVPLNNAAGVPVAVVSMLVEQRSKEALRSTLAMAEVLAGYVHGQAARGALRETQKASFALDLATRLIASINQAEGFKGATMQICNDLQRQFGVDRVGLGWVKGDRTKLTALSDTEHLDRRMAMVQKIEGAMDECLDQDQPVLYPPPPEANTEGAAGDGEPGEGDVLLSQAIVHAHRELAAGNAKLRIASLPLRVDDDVVGVLTIESTGDGDISLGTIEMLQAAMDLIAPVLKIRRSDDRMLPLRAWDSSLKSAAWAVGAKHTAWKLFGIGLLAAVAFLSLYKTEYLVTAEAMVRPAHQAVVSMPREGVIESLGPGVKVNARVKKGAVLVVLDSSELQLSKNEAVAKIMQAEAQAAAARAEGEEGAATRAELEAEGYRAQLDGLEYRIEQSTIVAPIDGTILEGDLEERVGSTMALGDPLMVIAPVDAKEDLMIVARVDERDIGLVSGVHHPEEGEFALGTLASKTEPNLRHELRVKPEGILPVARAEEGKNVFEVRAEIVAFDEDDVERLMPGMEGLARFRTERHSLMWIGTRRIVDMVRLWLWK